MTCRKPILFLSILLVYCCLYPNSTFASNDTIPKTQLDSTLVKYYHVSFDSLFLTSGKFIDTSLFSVSDPDILQRSMNIFSTLCNAGLAHKSLYFNPVFNNGFDLVSHAFDQYIRNHKSIRYLIPNQPFSSLYYIMGSKKEQQLNVSFGRELAPRLFVGMEYYLVNSPGPYKNSKSDNRAAYFTLRFNTKDERYAVAANYYNNKITVQENGGIVNDAQFFDNLESDRRIIGINLADAQNQIKETGFGLEQYVNLSPAANENDSIRSMLSRIKAGRITHRLSYHRNQMLFSEKSPLADFYADYDTAINQEKTHDSIYQHAFRNSIQWNTLGYKKYDGDVPFYLAAGVEHVYLRHKPDSVLTFSYSQLNPFASIRISVLKSAFLDGSVKLISGEQNQGDLEMKANLTQYLGTKTKNAGKLFFQANLINQEPSWLYKKFESNHFRWENNFSKSRFLNLTGSYSLVGITAGASWQLIDRYVYLNKAAVPQQFSGTATIYSLFSNLDVRLGRFDIKGIIRYQKTNNDTIIHLPEFSTRIKFTYSQALFNNAAIIQPGFTFTYFSAYYADTYMPALRSFYLQDSRLTGNYPFLDVFVALKVKRANIFLQYANIIGLSGYYQYMMVPHYPMRDPRFYFGVSWRFYQ